MDTSLPILLVGVLMVLALVCRMAFHRLKIPPAVGFLLLGFLVRLIDSQWGILHDNSHQAFSFLATLGVIALLFHVGLTSKLEKLVKQLGPASLVGLVSIAASAAVGYIAALLLGFGMIPRLVAATAMTATSVGIPVSVWDERAALGSEDGQLFLDVAELDDIFGVVLMGLLFALLPAFRERGEESLASVALKSGSLYAVKLFGFGLACFLFSRYLEQPYTRFFKQMEKPPEPMLLVAGTGIVFAAAAGMLGFSVAIGAFFAGLVFSRDPSAVKIDASFDTLYEFLTPFFFIEIGLRFDPATLGVAAYPALALFAAAALGKFLGAATPTLIFRGVQGAVILGVSMIPRAEITMIIMRKGTELGDWAVPSRLYSAMVLTTAATCVVGPVTLYWLLGRWEKEGE